MLSLLIGSLQRADNATQLHPLGMAVFCLLAVAQLLVPRRWAALPLLVLVCLMPTGQRVVLLTLDFTFVRLMTVVGWVRVFLRGEQRGFRARKLDWLVAWTTILATLVHTLQWGTTSAFVWQLGHSFDAFGLYFLFRCFVRSMADLDRGAKGLIWISFVVAASFLVESLTRKNLFAVFGGVPLETVAREGKLRCQGAFPHPILAGVFWASLLPLVASRWWTDPRHRLATALGVFACLAIVVLTASSTPLAVVALALIAAAAFPLRGHMRLVRWGVLAILVALHLAMNAPVWHLVARIDLVGGSTGWHRYHLIDQTIRRFGEWWLLGTRSTDHWGHGLQDVTNQYTLVAVRGGLVGLGLFLTSIAVAFGNVGAAWRGVAGSPAGMRVSWALGCSLFAQCVAFLAVAYFGQVIAVWYLVLAATASLEESARRWRGGKPRGRARPAEGSGKGATATEPRPDEDGLAKPLRFRYDSSDK